MSSQINFPKPRNVRLGDVDWMISEHSRATVKYYAEFSELTESEVVDEFLKELLKNDGFIKWVKLKKSNRRMVNQLQLTGIIELDKPENQKGESKNNLDLIVEVGDFG